MQRPFVPAAMVVAAIVALRFLRDYPWPLALMAGGAIGVLTWALRRTVDQLRALGWSRDQPSLVFDSGAPDGTPGPEDQGGDEQQMDESAQGETDQEQEQPRRREQAGEPDS